MLLRVALRCFRKYFATTKLFLLFLFFSKCNSAHTDGSYSVQSPFSVGMVQSTGNQQRNNEQMPAHESRPSEETGGIFQISVSSVHFVFSDVSSQQQGWMYYKVVAMCRVTCCCVLYVVDVVFSLFSYHSAGILREAITLQIFVLFCHGAQLKTLGSFDPFSTQQGQPKIGGDIDSALSNLADNLTISGNAQG